MQKKPKTTLPTKTTAGTHAPRVAAGQRVPTSAATTGPAKGKLVGAVVSAGKVLRYLRASPAPVTVTQIARQLKLNPSTCFNILRTLTEDDFVRFDEASKAYTLSLGVVALAKGALEQSIELKALQPKIQELAHRHSIMMTVWRCISPDRIMLVAAAESDAPVRIHARMGTRSPLLLGAAGRVFTAFANLDKGAMRERFGQLRLARKLDFATYLEQIDEVRQTGWAIDDGYVYPGTVSVAAPVLDANGGVNFCCSAVMFNGQYDPKRVSAIASELCALGRSLAPVAPPATAVAPTQPPAVKTQGSTARKQGRAVSV